MKEKRKNEQAKKDYYSSVLLSQIICSVFVVILFFSVKNSAAAEDLITAYSALLKPDFFSEKAESTFSAVKDYILNENASFAVSGSKVVPYEETTVPERTTTEETTAEAPEAETQAVFAPEKVSEISLTHRAEKTDEMLLCPDEYDGIIFPVEEGRITSYFGERTDPLSYEDDYHGGVDIGADEGDRIRAVYDGVVSCVGYDDISGNYIFLSHKNGYETFYCHCSEIIADEGAVIRQGETIALVGSTGYSTGPHLHFEIRLDEESIDPMPFLENAS